jgi:glycine dehydrogenase
MSLQTREQHIRRERATSNICTAQALLANMAGFFAVYHGPDGLRGIAERVHALTQRLADGLGGLGLDPTHAYFFDTVSLQMPDSALARFRSDAAVAGLYFRYEAATVGISLDETTTEEDVREILALAAVAVGQPAPDLESADAVVTPNWPEPLIRRSPFLTHPVFHRYRSETQMMRYVKQLERKDIGLDTSMIPLGSCTMKLTAATEMRPVSWPEFSPVHPFTPVEDAAGYQELFRELEDALCAITGLSAVSLQPNSGAQGEFAGLMVIRAYQRHQQQGTTERDLVLIPASAHGTNPASPVMAHKASSNSRKSS